MAATIDTSTVARGSATLTNAKDALARPRRRDNANRAMQIGRLGNTKAQLQRARQVATTGTTFDATLNPREALKFIQGDPSRAARVASKDLRRDAIEALLATIEVKPIT